jgi:hypothetical protein
VGFAAAVILLPWVSGGGYDLPFWDTRTAVFEEGLWDLITQNLGVGLLGLCVAAVVASAYDDTVKDNERTLQAVARVIPVLWAGALIFRLNGRIARVEGGALVNISVGIGAWAAVICGIGLAVAASPSSKPSPISRSSPLRPSALRSVRFEHGG